jgi:hypothetical protein
LKKARPRAECTQLCNERGLTQPKFGGKLNKIREEIAKETDPEKVQVLRQRGIGTRHEKLAEFCEFMCKVILNRSQATKGSTCQLMRQPSDS